MRKCATFNCSGFVLLMYCIVRSCKEEAVNYVEHCIPYNQTELLTCILTLCSLTSQ